MNQHVSESVPIRDPSFRDQCKVVLDRDGVLVLDGFLTPKAIETVLNEGKSRIGDAYFCESRHNVYLTDRNDDLPHDHVFNRQVVSSKGLIGDDQIPETSPLKEVYRDRDFQNFICHVVGEPAVHPYADPISSVNLHFAKDGQELGWHFDNSSFAITLLIQKPEGGGRFEYVRNLRDADAGDMNFDGVAEVLDGARQADVVEIEPGTLVLFRGRNSMHRVTPTKGSITRMLAVLAYNSKPGVSLSESAMKTFYGRVA